MQTCMTRQGKGVARALEKVRGIKRKGAGKTDKRWALVRTLSVRRPLTGFVPPSKPTSRRAPVRPASTAHIAAVRPRPSFLSGSAPRRRRAVTTCRVGKPIGPNRVQRRLFQATIRQGYFVCHDDRAIGSDVALSTAARREPLVFLYAKEQSEGA